MGCFNDIIWWILADIGQKSVNSSVLLRDAPWCGFHVPTCHTQHPIYNEIRIISKPQILDISDLYSGAGWFHHSSANGRTDLSLFDQSEFITTRWISFEYFSCLMFSVNVCSEHSSREWVTIWGRNFTHLHFDLERLKTDKHLNHSWVSYDGKHKPNIE